MRYVLVLERATRIGLDVFEAIGPFETIAEAREWSRVHWSDAGMPDMILRAMIDPERAQ